MINIKEQYDNEIEFDLTSTLSKLEYIEKVLKSEFIGIDEQIDILIENIKPWLFFRNTLTKPLVINLWGMTGCGKTKLIERLVDLLEIRNNSYRINGSEFKKGYALDTFLCAHLLRNNYPILILDEIQNYRCKDNFGNEYEEYESKYWDFIDTGIIQSNTNYINRNDTLGLRAMQRVLETLQALNNKTFKHLSFTLTNDELDTINKFIENYNKDGEDSSPRMKNYRVAEFPCDITVSSSNNDEVEYSNGSPEISHNFFKCLNRCFDKIDDRYCLKDKFIKSIEKVFFLYRIQQENLEGELKSLNLNEYETLIYQILNFLVDSEITPEVDFSKSLIFVLGNLDEAYKVHYDMNPDISADQFNKITKKINIINIKEALQNRFRDEHISRLGNTHIIYPSLTSKAYHKIIEKLLNDYSGFLYEKNGILVEYDDTVYKILYKESVYPTQGVRPLISSVNEVIKTKVPNILSYGISNNITFDKLKFKYNNNKFIVSLIQNDKEIDTYQFKHEFKLNDLRKSKKDDRQAIVAVHESGHAVAHIVLSKNLPDKICSVTADATSGGFMMSDVAKEVGYLNKEVLFNRIICLLAGKAAEEIIFGDMLVTSGASHDLMVATTTLSMAYRKYGMFDVLSTKTFNSDDRLLKEFDGEINIKVEEQMKELFVKTKELINQEKPLLLALSEHLSNNSTIGKGKLKDIVKNYVTTVKYDDIISNKKEEKYRDILNSVIVNENFGK